MAERDAGKFRHLFLAKDFLQVGEQHVFLEADMLAKALAQLDIDRLARCQVLDQNQEFLVLAEQAFGQRRVLDERQEGSFLLGKVVADHRLMEEQEGGTRLLGGNAGVLDPQTLGVDQEIVVVPTEVLQRRVTLHRRRGPGTRIDGGSPGIGRPAISS